MSLLSQDQDKSAGKHTRHSKSAPGRKMAKHQEGCEKSYYETIMRQSSSGGGRGSPNLLCSSKGRVKGGMQRWLFPHGYARMTVSIVVSQDCDFSKGLLPGDLAWVSIEAGL